MPMAWKTKNRGKLKPPELPGAERFEIRIDLQRIKFFGPKFFVDDFAFYPFTHCVTMP